MARASRSSQPKSQTALLLEAAEKYLKELHGLDQLDHEKFQKAILDYVQGKTLQDLQKQYGIHAATCTAAEEVLMIDSGSEEDWDKT